MSDKKILPTPEELKKIINKHLGYAEEEIYEAIEQYSQNLVKYTLEQAAEKGKTVERSMDNYSSAGALKWSEVNKQSILSLKGEIIKDLGL